jgi:hypothetical protein
VGARLNWLCESQLGFTVLHVLKIAGPQVPKKIQALVNLRDFTYVATGCDIVVFKRAHQVHPQIWNLSFRSFSFCLTLKYFFDCSSNVAVYVTPDWITMLSYMYM